MNDLAKKVEFWDEWQLAAVAAGVAVPLAELGCEVLRTHRKNRWSKEFLGVEDDGPVMLEMCLDDPAQAEMLFLENLHPYDAALLAAARSRLGLMS
ncbi:hypothetical protein CR105_14985 [Massilia eurypsychrophila]|uniref:Uncharacterized protein n=1 Tax=Massilia eurypsychrophila TaxID=1485217 RepID=A0A2G8TEE3_9BURK|nr:hypothetical protein [Massilia eurypsychrophila]PIL44364.1 hypothetical protein CR105_14985 [Massilia eurypsychrophila]